MSTPVRVEYFAYETNNWGRMTDSDASLVLQAIRDYDATGRNVQIDIGLSRVVDVSRMIQYNVRSQMERPLRLFYDAEPEHVWQFEDDDGTFVDSDMLSFAINARRCVCECLRPFCIQGSQMTYWIDVVQRLQTNEVSGRDRTIRRTINDSVSSDDGDDDFSDLIDTLMEDDSLPDEFVCPITNLIMLKPMLAEDGHTYEKAAIRKWLCKKQSSPLTNLPMGTKLVPNAVLRERIGKFVDTY